MCYDLYHQCKYCGSQYACSLENYVCPTINRDVDAQMCDICRAKEKEDFRKLMESNEPLPNRPLDISDWENKS